MSATASNLTDFDWSAHALAGHAVQLGQIDKPSVIALNRLVREGKLARCRGYWSGHCIGPLKTIWAAPGETFRTRQIVEIVEATPAFIAADEHAREFNFAEAA